MGYVCKRRKDRLKKKIKCQLEIQTNKKDFYKNNKLYNHSVNTNDLVLIDTGFMIVSSV